MVWKKKSTINVEDSDVHGGTEAWNIAQYFTGYSIALPLKDLNDLEDVARFGAVKIDDDLMMTDDQVDKRRADAVRRYWAKLKQVVGDTMFKIRRSDRDKALAIHEWLLEVPQYFDGLLSMKKDSIDDDDRIKVNENFLVTLLNQMVEKKQLYLYLLDHAGLIFKESDEIDLDKITRDFVEGG